MKPTITLLLGMLLLVACSPMRNLQKVETRIPCLGSVGKTATTLLRKDFVKAGEPNLKNELEVALNEFDFSNAMLAKYTKYQETQGKGVSAQNDSIKVIPSKYFQLRISDLVGLKSQLNAVHNASLKEYLQDDSELALLTGISFRADEQTTLLLRTSRHFFLREEHGSLLLEANKGQKYLEIPMDSLEVFDFETSQICWKQNRQTKLEVAAIILEGKKCPGATEKNPDKLYTTKSYLKL